MLAAEAQNHWRALHAIRTVRYIYPGAQIRAEMPDDRCLLKLAGFISKVIVRCGTWRYEICFVSITCSLSHGTVVDSGNL